MTDHKKTFDALPHINTIWVTEDGNFHLHQNNGGVEITRESIENDVDAKDGKKIKGK
jgi:hypothetical protein